MLVCMGAVRVPRDLRAGLGGPRHQMIPQGFAGLQEKPPHERRAFGLGEALESFGAVAFRLLGEGGEELRGDERYLSRINARLSDGVIAWQGGLPGGNRGGWWGFFAAIQGGVVLPVGDQPELGKRLRHGRGEAMQDGCTQWHMPVRADVDDEPRQDGGARKPHPLVEQMLCHLRQSRLGQHPPLGLGLNPGCELRLGLAVQWLQPQGGHNMGPMLGLGGFPCWHFDRQRGWQSELWPYIADNVGRPLMDVREEMAG